MITSYSNLKKTANKYTWTLVGFYDEDGVLRPHKYLNVVRKVTKLQTSSVRLEDSWLEFPPAKDVTIDEDTLNGSYYVKFKTFVTLEYRLDKVAGS